MFSDSRYNLRASPASFTPFRPTSVTPRWRRNALAAAVIAAAVQVSLPTTFAQSAGQPDNQPAGPAVELEPLPAPEERAADSDGATAGEATEATTGPTTAAPSRNGNGPAGVTQQEGGLVLNFRDASIDVVLDELSEAAGFIVVKQARPQGRVTLTSRQPVSAEDAVTLLNTVLHNAGYSAIRQGRILKIVDLQQARHLNIPVRSGRDPNEIEPTDELITQVIPLRHADATQLRQDLEPVVNPGADFAANASSNALIITDTAANVRRVVEIIDALDTSLADSVEVKVFQLEFADASNAAQLINDVFGNLEVGPGAGQEQPEDPRERWRRMREGDQGNNNQQGARGSRVNAAADARTNSVVVTGPADTLEIVSGVIDELDANPIADETVFVYRLRNAQALNVEAVVNNLFGNTTGRMGGTATVIQNPLQNLRGNTRVGGGSFGSGGGMGGTGAQTGRFGGGTGTGGFGGGGGFGATGAQTGRFGNVQQQQTGGNQRVSNRAQQTASELAGQVTIIADTDTNSLLVRTSPQNYEKVRTVLEELDRPVAQVLIKVLIAEVTHDDTLDFGAELSVLNLRANGLGQSAGTNFNMPTQGAAATGLVVQVLEDNFTAAIRALETTGKLDVLSRPYILASDNQVASITVGQSVPFVDTSRITDEGGIINTTRYGDVGILLDVIPHINPDGLVILDVAPEISALTGTSVQLNELVSQPIIARRSALSRVGVRNGETIVIGGLMEDRKTQTVNKIPILGDIPLLGNAFKRTQTTKVKTELLIFLTPHVASNPDLLGDMGQEELDGTELVPNAVRPGQLQEHLNGLQRGRTADLPSEQQTYGPTTLPTTQPDNLPSTQPTPDAQPRPRRERRQ